MGSQASLHLDGNNQFAGQRSDVATGSIHEQIEQLQMYQNQGGQLTPEQAAQLHQAQLQLQMQGQKPAQQRARGPPAARNMPSSDGSSEGIHPNPIFNQVTEQNIMKLQKQFQVNVDPKSGSYIESSNSGSDFTIHLLERIKAQQQQRAMKEQQQVQQSQSSNSSSNQTQNSQQVSQQQIQNILQYVQNMTPQQQQEYINQFLAQQQNLGQFGANQQHTGQQQASEQQLANMLQEQISQQLAQQNQAQLLQNIQQSVAHLTPQQQQMLLEQHYDKLPIFQALLQQQKQMEGSGAHGDQNMIQNNPVALQMLMQQLLQNPQASTQPIANQPPNQFVGGKMMSGNQSQQHQANAFGQPIIQMPSEMIPPGGYAQGFPQQMKAGAPDQSAQLHQQQLQAQMQQMDQINQNNFLNQSSMSATDPQMMQDLSGGGNPFGAQGGQNFNQMNPQPLTQMQIQHLQNAFWSKVEHIFQWSFGGEVVEIMGHFNSWQGERMQKVEPQDNMKAFGVTQQNLRMNQSPPTHYFVKFLDPQKVMYKFRVDGNWRYAPDQDITRDERGNENNIIDLTNSKTIGQFIQENKAYQAQLTPQQQYQQQMQLLGHNQYQMLVQQLQQQLILPQTLTSLHHQQLAAAALAHNIPGFTAAQGQPSNTPGTQAQHKPATNSGQAQGASTTLDSQAQAALNHLLQQKQIQHIAQSIHGNPPVPGPAPATPAKSDEAKAKPVNQQQKKSERGTQSQNSGNQPRSGNQASTGAGQGEVENMPQENIYHQNLPDETEEQMQDPQTLPIHFSYNFMERDHIPLHNEKYSRMNNEHQKQAEVIKKGFFDKTLPAPSHVILNHINSWDVMYPLDHEGQEASVSEQETATQGMTTAPTLASTSALGQNKSIQTQNGMTCITMPQRLNRSKFMTMVYYKPNKLS